MADARIQIPAELFALAESSRFEGTCDLPVLEVGPDDFRFLEPVAWHVDITNTGSALLVAGSVSGSATCACSRCLEDVAYDFEGDIEGYFLIDESGSGDFADGEDDVPGEDEFDILPPDHIIDLAPLIGAALMVDAPAMPLCSDYCKGLCPQCGANLNEGPCGCGRDESLEAFEREANPFAALADFKFE